METIVPRHCGDHFTMYAHVKSLCSTPEANTTPFQLKKKKGHNQWCQIMLGSLTRKGLWSTRFSHKEVASDLGSNLFFGLEVGRRGSQIVVGWGVNK